MIIRAARRQDAPLIRELIYELALYEKAPEEARATISQIEGAFFGEHPAVFCDFVESDGAVAGFAVWFLNYSTWTGTHGIYLEDLFVRPGFRGRGYGRALLVHLAGTCVQRGYQRLQWSVLDWNQSAIDFYRSLGAEALDEWTGMRVAGTALVDLAGARR